MSADTEDATADGVECPTCGDGFETTTAMRIHHTKAHGESLVETETSVCEVCGEEFEVSPNAKGRYCSDACDGLARRDRVERTCEECGEPFQVPPSKSHYRFCSPDCDAEAKRVGDSRECPMCGRDFSVPPSAPDTYCCRACFMESRVSKPRPGSVDGLLWLLYVYEDHNMVETYRRQRAVLGADECLQQDDVHEWCRNSEGLQEGTRRRRAAIESDVESILGESADGADETWRRYSLRSGGDD